MVRIVENFWENYQEYEEQIISSILHIVRRQFPNPDPQGEAEDINHVITELHRLNIFGKFDRKRLTSKTRTTRQQFENFLYQRIWAILYGEYGRRRKRTVRFKRVAAVECIRQTKSAEETLYDDKYLRDMKPHPDPIEEERLQHVRACRHLTKDDVGVVCSVIENTDDATLTKDTRNKVLKACADDRDRKVVTMKEEGYQNREIAETLNVSGSCIAVILGRIKKRYEEMA